MNIKLALKSAAVSLALAIASIPAFCVEPVTSYVPSDAAGAVYLNLETLFASPAFGSILESFGVNVDEMLEAAGVAADDKNAQLVVFFMPDGRGGLVANTNGKSGEFRKFLTENEEIGAGKVEFKDAEAYEIKAEEGSEHVFLMIVSEDQVQALVSRDSDAKPELFPEVEAPSALVRSLKADDSIFAFAFDRDGILKTIENTSETGPDGLAAQLDQLKSLAGESNDLKSIIFRIASGEDNSIDLFLTARFNDANARGEFVEQIDTVKKMFTPAEGEEENANEAAKFLESLKVETKGNDAVISLNISADSIVEAVQAGTAAAMGALGEDGAIGAEEDEEEMPDFEAMVPLEETPDPDEEGIDDEERQNRIQMREEAIQAREAKIAELRAEYEQNAAAREEAKRVAALNKKLFEYLEEKNWEAAFDMVSEGADVNAKDKNGRTPAFYCIENGNYTILNNLDKAGKNKVDPNAQDNTGLSLLHCAVLKKQDAIITYLLKVRACSPRTQITKTGASPIYDAARIGTAENVKSLVTFGADVNAATNTGLTALHQAAARGNLDMVKELVQAGADVNAVAKNGRTPIFYAAARAKASTVNYLLENKAEINLADVDGITPLHLAAASGNVALVKFMVTNKKANFAATANDGTTVLISGAKYPEIVKFLAEKMPNVNGVDKDGNSVLHLCAETADEETIRKLLYYSVKEDLPNKKGETPIQLAARAGNLDMVKRLLNMNVKVTQKIVDEAKTQEIKDLLSARLKK